jgi:ATP-dependent helicase/nuclease subunit A
VYQSNSGGAPDAKNMALERNTVVLASAGTGKTRKLVEVYLELLERGVDPLRIVAVTFTEKAAAEMRDRIRTAVYERHGPEWIKILSILPAAPISTIHGFCGILLREHGFHLGIDPSFTILDEQRSIDLARESAREAIRQEIHSGNVGVEELFGDFGLERLVETLISAGYWMNSLGVDSAWLEARIGDQVRAAADVEKSLSVEMEKYGGNVEAIGQLADEMDARKARHPLRKRDDADALLPRLGQIASVSAARHLSLLVATAAAVFRGKKRSLNALDFDDLLLGVRDLLKNDTAMRSHYRQHFQALLIDEFQDTDEVQAEIISLLGEDADGSGRFTPGKLMIVGDPKQSIYRFRRARVTVFFRMLDRIVKEGGVVEHLQENYRSAPQIAEFSNRLSQLAMDGRGKHSGITSDDADLTYRIKFAPEDALKPKSDSPFLGITYVAAESGARAAQGRNMEAEAIARLLKEWKAAGTIQSWKEVALLFRAMTNVDIYLEALEAHGIPVYVVQGARFYEKTEVSDLIAFLELILHPQDQLLRTIVLSSSLIGAEFRELVPLRAGRGWDHELDGRRVRVEVLDELLKPWLSRRDSATAAEILQDVIRKTNFDVVMMAQKNGRQRVANIGKLIEITRGLARQGTTALDDVVRYLRDRAQDTSIREPEAQIVRQDDEVVRVLSVHQAKGLEFDIVIVPDLAARTGRNTSDRTFFSDRWGILVGAAYGLHRKALPHSLILQSKLLDEDQQYEEEKRLLYVAVTRAKKMLVLGEGFSKQAGPWLQWTEQLLEEAHSGALARARDGKAVTVRAKGFTVKVVPASQLNGPEQLRFNADSILVAEPVIPLLKTPRVISTIELTPSDLTSLAGCFRYFHWTRILGIAEPGRPSTGNTPQMRLGSVAHKVLETGSVPSAEKLTTMGLHDLGAVFESSDWQSLVSAVPEREMPFIMHIKVDGKDCWIRGRMDVVVPAAVPRVVDYKYATWQDGCEADYEMQMTAYSVAVMKALGTDRAVSELWYLKRPMKILRKEYGLPEAQDRLKSLLSRYMSAVETNEWPATERAHCDRMECGFRSQCWAGA